MSSGSVNKIEESAKNIIDNSKRIDEIDRIDGNIVMCKANYISILNKLDELNNDARIYNFFMGKIFDIISYLDDAIETMNKLDSSYAWEDQNFDSLKNKVFNRGGQWDGMIADCSSYKQEVEYYINNSAEDSINKIESLRKQSSKVMKELDNISTNEVKSIICELKLKVENIMDEVRSKKFEYKRYIDSLGYQAVNNIKTLVDYIVNFEEDELLTKIRAEYKKILIIEKEKSGITSLNIDFSKIDFLNADKEEGQLTMFSSKFPTTLERCIAQEMLINKCISISASSLSESYSMDMIKEQFESVRETTDRGKIIFKISKMKEYTITMLHLKITGILNNLDKYDLEIAKANKVVENFDLKLSYLRRFNAKDNQKNLKIISSLRKRIYDNLIKFKDVVNYIRSDINVNIMELSNAEKIVENFCKRSLENIKFIDMEINANEFDPHDIKRKIDDIDLEYQGINSYIDSIFHKVIKIDSFYQDILVKEMKEINECVEDVKQNELYKGIIKDYAKILCQRLKSVSSDTNDISSRPEIPSILDLKKLKVEGCLMTSNVISNAITMLL